MVGDDQYLQVNILWNWSPRIRALLVSWSDRVPSTWYGKVQAGPPSTKGFLNHWVESTFLMIKKSLKHLFWSLFAKNTKKSKLDPTQCFERILFLNISEKNLNFACFSKNIESFLKQFAFNTQKIFFSKFDDSTPKNCHKNWELFEMFESTVVQTILTTIILWKKKRKSTRF